MKIGDKIFDNARTHLMGIINVTPDSFSDGGKNFSLENALKTAEQMIEDGADIIDIGAQSTRPNYCEISATEELGRLLPVLTEIKKRFNTPVSVDTYFAEVAHAVLENGADMINDIWGLRAQNMAKIIARHDAVCCLMHNRDREMDGHEGIDEILCDLKAVAEIATEAGIKRDKIILDPGVGFAKTAEHNLKILANLDRLNEIGYPILLGVSRKSVIGKVLDLPVGERLEGTLATTALATSAGIMFLRVHDIKENKRVVNMIEEIKKWKT